MKKARFVLALLIALSVKLSAQGGEKHRKNDFSIYNSLSTRRNEADEKPIDKEHESYTGGIMGGNCTKLPLKKTREEEPLKTGGCNGEGIKRKISK